VLLIRRIRELLYEQGFTISGARNRLDELASQPAEASSSAVDRAYVRSEIRRVIELLH
jgi:hypothetical protein